MSKINFGFEKIHQDEKENRVAGVFDSVAKNYDLMNDLMSFGMHRIWKEVLVEIAELNKDSYVLDVASGTCDIPKIVLREFPNNKVYATDINHNMLEVGYKRSIDENFFNNLFFGAASGEKLPFKDNTFDAIFVGFGIRNFTNIKVGLKEMRRCLKNNGNLIILEFSSPQSGIFQSIYDWYSFKILPKIGRLVANDENSYKYLVESIRMHPNQEKLKSMIIDSGYNKCKFFNLLNGVVAIHKAVK